jgi:hypothetical protein
MDYYAPSQLPDIDAVELVDLKGLQPNLVSEYMKIAQNAPFVRVKGETAQQIAPNSQPRVCNP